MKKIRLLDKIYALVNGYFWLPCPICGEEFGGHEASGSLMDGWYRGRSVCPKCVGIADDRNKKFMADNPHPPLVPHN